MQEIIDRLDRIEAALNRPQVPLDYLDTEQAAQFLGMSSVTLEHWRNQAIGPTFIKIGKSVRYAVTDLRSFMEARRQTPLS